MYADIEYYENTFGGSILNDEKQLVRASEDIDTLTFNRIKNFDDLTEYQKAIIQKVCCQFAEFKEENAEILESPFNSYSLNGVTMDFSKANIKQVNGIYIPNNLYNELKKTGLCCLSFRRC